MMPSHPLFARLNKEDVFLTRLRPLYPRLDVERFRTWDDREHEFAEEVDEICRLFADSGEWPGIESHLVSLVLQRVRDAKHLLYCGGKIPDEWTHAPLEWLLVDGWHTHGRLQRKLPRPMAS